LNLKEYSFFKALKGFCSGKTKIVVFSFIKKIKDQKTHDYQV